MFCYPASSNNCLGETLYRNNLCEGKGLVKNLLRLCLYTFGRQELRIRGEKLSPLSTCWFWLSTKSEGQSCMQSLPECGSPRKCFSNVSMPKNQQEMFLYKSILVSLPEILTHKSGVGLRICIFNQCCLRCFPPNYKYPLGSAMINILKEVGKARGTSGVILGPSCHGAYS